MRLLTFGQIENTLHHPLNVGLRSHERQTPGPLRVAGDSCTLLLHYPHRPASAKTRHKQRYTHESRCILGVTLVQPRRL